MPRGVLAALVGVALGASAAASAEDMVQIAPLHVIPTQNSSAQPIPPDAPLRVRLSGPHLEALASALGVRLVSGQDSFEYVIGAYPQLQAAVKRTWLEPTFVVDYDEPAMQPLRQELAARGARISRSQLVQYVAGLVEASDDRDWDLASMVATRRKGDCSEHAVLTAALARALGTPARVVIGVALVSQGQEHGAFGHAWTEMLEDGQWRVADAALHDAASTVRYLPIGLMEDEGMGYAMELMRVVQLWVDRVVILGPG
jgi:transglutaminase-like putative cysteine protease